MIDMNDTLAVARPAPKPYSFSRPYWEATRERRLLIQYCKITGKPQFYPRPTSMFTGRRQLEWREVSGHGVLYTYTVARRGRGPFQGHEPYLIANVQLDVGVHIIGNLVECGSDQVAIGMRVSPCWAPLPEGYHQLMFVPDRVA